MAWVTSQKGHSSLFTVHAPCLFYHTPVFVVSLPVKTSTISLVFTMFIVFFLCCVSRSSFPLTFLGLDDFLVSVQVFYYYYFCEILRHLLCNV